MARPKGETGLWKPDFLAALERKPIVSYAARCAGITPGAAYAAKKVSEANPDTNDFAERWEQAMEAGLDGYEENLIEIGMGERKGGNVTAFIYMLNVRRYQKRSGTDAPSKLILEWGGAGDGASN